MLESGGWLHLDGMGKFQVFGNAEYVERHRHQTLGNVNGFLAARMRVKTSLAYVSGFGLPSYGGGILAYGKILRPIGTGEFGGVLHVAQASENPSIHGLGAPRALFSGPREIATEGEELSTNRK